MREQKIKLQGDIWMRNESDQMCLIMSVQQLHSFINQESLKTLSDQFKLI